MDNFELPPVIERNDSTEMDIDSAALETELASVAEELKAQMPQ